MNTEQRLEKIIESHLPALKNGLETIDSVLEMFPKDARELRPRLEAALWLAEASITMGPRPGYITSSRNYLEKRIASLPHQSLWWRFVRRYTPQRWVFNIVSPVTLILLFVFVANSLVLAAKLSIPGDPLYATKLAIEDIQLAFTFSPENKVDLYMQFSRDRATEFVELVLQGDYDQLPSAANRMETDMISTLHSLNVLAKNNPATESPKLSSLRESYSQEITILNLLKEISPSSAHSGIELAIRVAQSGIMALH